MQNATANIVSTSNRVDFGFKFNKCKSMEEIDKSLPTMVIGYKLAKETIKGFNILTKCYPEQNVRWTYLKTEKRTDYDKDLNAFQNNVIKDITNKVKYKLVDVIKLNTEEKEIIWKKFLSDNKKTIYDYYNKFLFVYVKEENIVYGLPLTTCRYLGKNTDKILNKMRKNENNTFIYDFNEIPAEIRKKLEADIHYLVALNEYFC